MVLYEDIGEIMYHSIKSKKHKWYGMEYETTEQFLARGGEITTEKNEKEHLIKKQKKLGQPTILKNDYSNDEFERRLHRFYNSKTWKYLKEQVYKNQPNKCLVCGSREDLRVDHIKPVRHFPNLIDDLNNLQILCNECNLDKGSMIGWTLEWHQVNKDILKKNRKNR